MKPLIFFCLIQFFVISAFGQEKRLALIIGNANYDKGALKNPVNDALLMKETLEKLDFEVMLDTNLKSKSDLSNSIIAFGEKRKNYNIGFVYYAGHGVQLNGKNYLLATKEKYENKYHVEDNGVNVDRLLGFFEEAKNQINILVLDACRNNPFEKNWVPSARSLENGLGLAPLNSSGNVIAFSTSAGNTASDGNDKSKNSSYCLSLVKNMLTPDLDLDQIFRNVKKEIREISGGNQLPTVENQYEGSDFYFLKSTYTDQIIEIDSLIDAKEYDLALEKVSVVLTKSPNNKKALLRRGRIDYSKRKDYNGFHLHKADTLYPNDSEVYEYLGRYFYTIGDFEDAIKYIDRAILIIPDDPNLHHKKAIFHEAVNEIQQAENAYNNSVLYDIKNALRYENRSSFYINFFQDYKKALIDIEYAIKLEPINQHLWYKRGYINYYLGNENQAIIDFRKALAIDSNLIDGITWIGKIFELKKDYYSAIAEYEKGIVLEKSNPQAAVFCYFNRAGIYTKQNKLDEALRDYQKVIELDDKNGDWFYHRANFYLNVIQDYNNALIDYSKAIELNPTNLDYLYARGDLYATFLKKNTQALNDFEKILQIDPKNVDAINAIGNILEEERKYDLAITQYEKGIALEKTNPQSAAFCFSNRAIIYTKQNKLEEALSDYNKAIEIDIKNGDRYYNRANFYLDVMADYNNALIDYSKAIELNPSNVHYLYARGILFSSFLKKNNKAINDFEQILQIDPKNVDAIKSIGNILEEEEKYDLAITQYEKGIVLEKSNPQAASFCYVNRAMIYSKQNRYEEALNDYNKAINLNPKNSEIYWHRADFNENKLHRPYDALVDYSIGISLDSSQTFGWFHRGLLFSNQLNDHKSAIRDYEYLLKIDSNDVSVLNWLGVLYGRLGEDSIEFDYYNRTLLVTNANFKEKDEYNVNLAWSCNNLAYYYQKENNNSKSLEFYNKAIELDPLEPLRHYERAWFGALYLDDYTGAINDINNAIKCDVKNNYWLLQRAKLNLIAQKNKMAKSDFLKLVNDEINSVSNICELANFYSIVKENESANFYFKKAEQLDSNSSKFLHMYTNHLIRNELWGMAIKIAQKSIRNNKLDTIANCQLGEIYLADKNLLKALNSFLEAENIIELSEKIKEIDESDESQIFLSDIQKKISEIYSALGEVELACLYINKAIHSLNNETRSKKREQLKVLYDIKEKYHN